MLTRWRSRPIKQPITGRLQFEILSKLIQIETQIKNLALNSLTYTGFLEFNMENCGKEFIKAFSSNMIEFSVFDSKGSDGLYTVQGQKAVL